MLELTSSLYRGVVMHHRFRPVTHRFKYNVFSCCLDLDELSALDKLRLFSVNRFNLFSFYDKDFCNGKGSTAVQIRTLLVERGFYRATARIKLLCYPRILGFAFNPLSVYFCYDKNGDLAVVLYEVSNTFGSRHTYILEANTQSKRSDSIIRHKTSKELYVSPFMAMHTHYAFRIQPPCEKVAVCIRQSSDAESDAESQVLLHATFTGNKEVMSDIDLFKVFFLYPLMTFKVLWGIHWHALRLWRKRLGIQPREKGSFRSISWLAQNGEYRYERL